MIDFNVDRDEVFRKTMFMCSLQDPESTYYMLLEFSLSMGITHPVTLPKTSKTPLQTVHLDDLQLFDEDDKRFIVPMLMEFQRIGVKPNHYVYLGVDIANGHRRVPAESAASLCEFEAAMLGLGITTPDMPVGDERRYAGNRIVPKQLVAEAYGYDLLKYDNPETRDRWEAEYGFRVVGDNPRTRPWTYVPRDQITPEDKNNMVAVEHLRSGDVEAFKWYYDFDGPDQFEVAKAGIAAGLFTFTEQVMHAPNWSAFEGEEPTSVALTRALRELCRARESFDVATASLTWAESALRLVKRGADPLDLDDDGHSPLFEAFTGLQVYDTNQVLKRHMISALSVVTTRNHWLPMSDRRRFFTSQELDDIDSVIEGTRNKRQRKQMAQFKFEDPAVDRLFGEVFSSDE